MQITFQTHFPKEIKGAFVYERKNGQSLQDAIDALLLEVAQNVSDQISDEPQQITTFPGVRPSDFYAAGYHSKKTITLHIYNMDDILASPVIHRITVHFDTADSHFIENRVNDEQIFQLRGSLFNRLNTLVTI